MIALPRRLGHAIALVCAVHALVLWRGVATRLPKGADEQRSPVFSTRWIEPPAVQNNEPEKLLPPPQPRASARMPRPLVNRASEVQAQPGATDSRLSLDEAAPVLLPAPESSEPAIRADSILRAVRESARQKGLAAMSDERLGQQPVDAQAALRQGMASAARTDCLKGGDAGYGAQGLGLFALPMLVIDASSGRCSR